MDFLYYVIFEIFVKGFCDKGVFCVWVVDDGYLNYGECVVVVFGV